MHAETGDWLVVRSSDLGHEARKGEIVEVRSRDGAPPYLVRWLDDGRLGLVFPGPEAHVVPVAELAELERVANARIDRVQRDLVHSAAPEYVEARRNLAERPRTK